MDEAEQYHTDMLIEYVAYQIFDEREDLYEYWCEKMESHDDAGSEI